MPTYNGRHSSPLNDAYPAPYVTVRIEHGGVVRELPALLDTGADITVVPALAVEALGLQQISDDLELHDATGGVTFDAPMYVADIQFDGFVVRRLAITITKHAAILIGRDVLNEYIATFDGPRGQFTLQEP